MQDEPEMFQQFLKMLPFPLHLNRSLLVSAPPVPQPKVFAVLESVGLFGSGAVIKCFSYT